MEVAVRKTIVAEEVESANRTLEDGDTSAQIDPTIFERAIVKFALPSISSEVLSTNVES